VPLIAHWAQRLSMGLDPSAPAPKKKIPSIVGVRSDVATPAPILLRQSLEGRTRSLRGAPQSRAVRQASPVSNKSSRRARSTGSCRAASSSTAAGTLKPVASQSTASQVSTSEPVAKQSRSTVAAAKEQAQHSQADDEFAAVIEWARRSWGDDEDAEWLERARHYETVAVEAPQRSSDDERELSERPPTRSPDPVPASATPSANQHNDSTLRVTPLPAPNFAAQRVRVLPMAPRSSIAPLIAIVCLLAAGLAIGVYFALPYVIDWYKSERVPSQVDEARAPESIVPQPIAGDPAVAPSIAGKPTAVPTKKKAKRSKATKKRVGAEKAKKHPN